jgi:hypothetical protein
MLRVLVVLALLGAAAGCGPSFVQLTARQTGCAPNAIEISELHEGVLAARWKASCHARVWECRRNDNGVTTCAGERGAADVAAAASAAPPDGVTKTRTGDGRTMLTARFTEDPFTFVLAALPDRHLEGAVLSIRVPAALVGKGCGVRVMVDGQLQPALAAAPAAPAEADAARVRVRVPYDLLQKLVPPFAVAGRVCEEEWRLGPGSQALVAELVQRLAEAGRWQERPAPAAPLPPAGPTP